LLIGNKLATMSTTLPSISEIKRMSIRQSTHTFKGKLGCPWCLSVEQYISITQTIMIFP
jgi:hypothetical protein